jgi:hypothetical protein
LRCAIDILLDTDLHDIIFVNGSAPVTTTQQINVAQRIKITLQTFLGEWFLNTTVGVPYFEAIFGKVKSKASIDLLLQEKILADPGVIEMVSFESELDNSKRVYSMSFKVRTSEGVTDDISITLGA